ncbi:MAG: hypothetical protein A4E56_00376 [Pelotomaculum sp. PtaU1.Bin065]|nr:MAG: hypothetical protein A4E56_00376 [Pelotomaculum sp. PtaU1.Bin065]
MENNWNKVADINPNVDVFLAYDANCDHICIGRKAWLYRSPEGNLRMPARNGSGMEITHWMPLPKRPHGK